MSKQLEELLTLVFAKTGLLSRSLEGFEERHEQRAMTRQILEAYHEDRIALIEAGTGTGKSFAYLIPALFWAAKHQEKTVISTHTIALQEQLLKNDIPFLASTLDIDVKVSLVKGMGNYVCLRKLKELQTEPLLVQLDEAREVQAIDSWSDRTQDGSRSDLPFPVSPQTWEKVAAEGDNCTHVQCPHFKQCFFFKARKEAIDSQILIVNHHLLFSDVQARKDKKDSILPAFERLVLDEAHHVEQVALESFAGRIDRLNLIRTLGKLCSDTHPEKSRLFLLRRDLLTLAHISPQLIRKIEIDLPAEKRRCGDALENAFAAVLEFLDAISKQQPGKEVKWRLTPALLTHPLWKERVIPTLKTLADLLKDFSISLFPLQPELEALKTTPIADKLSNHAVELQALTNRIEEASQFLHRFLEGEELEKRVRWIEASRTNIAIYDAALDVSQFCKEALFSPLRTSVLCSATLATAREFSFAKERLGLGTFKTTENVYDSPFDYAQRSLFLVPLDLPAPQDVAFLPAAVDLIERAITASEGSAFLLFTSYDMLHKCYEKLRTQKIAEKYSFLKQGDFPRHMLLEQFKREKGSVLFATDSFWEGVDVPGEALRLVVIAKLPFSVPTEPLYQAYTDALEKEGKDAFMDYSVPQAVIKFKQGFGRLLRKSTDRGCILCLDNRIVKKNYGKIFLGSLPPAATCFAPTEKVLAEMRAFYIRTKPT